VTRYLHVRGSASRPYGYGEDHLPYAIGRLLAEEELRRQPTLLHVLTSLGFRPGAMTHSLEPCNANDEVARRLDVEVGDAIIRIDGVLTSEDGTVLSVYRFFVREGRGIQVHLTRAGDPLVLAKEAKRPARDMAPMP
jgi:DNA-binding GntR family transcriptional regulator